MFENIFLKLIIFLDPNLHGFTAPFPRVNEGSGITMSSRKESTSPNHRSQHAPSDDSRKNVEELVSDRPLHKLHKPNFETSDFLLSNPNLLKPKPDLPSLNASSKNRPIDYDLIRLNAINNQFNFEFTTCTLRQ